MGWNDTDTIMAKLWHAHLRDGDGGGLAASAAAAMNAEPAAMAAAVIAPTSARSAAPAGSAAPVYSGHAFQRFLRRSARLHTVTKTTAARAVARAQATIAATRDARSRRARAMGAPLRRSAPRGARAQSPWRFKLACLLASLYW